MVIFDVGASFLLSGLMAKQFKGQRPDISITAPVLTMAPAGLFFLERYTDWDWQYLVEPAELPTGMSAIFVASIVLAAVAGRMVALARPRVFWSAFGAFGIYCAAFARRTVYVGTREQYFTDAAVFLPTDFLIHVAIAGVWATLVLGTAIWLSKRALQSRSVA